MLHPKVARISISSHALRLQAPMGTAPRCRLGSGCPQVGSYSGAQLKGSGSRKKSW